MKPIDVRKVADLIPMPIELRGRSDKETIKKITRKSPDVSRMQRITDPSGTLWAFSSEKKARYFVSHREELQRKSTHFLSGREILEGFYQ